MAADTPVEQSKNGTHARVTFIKDIEIKDIWSIAMGIMNGTCKEWSEEERKVISEELLDLWQITHDLKTHIIDRE